MVVRFLSFGEVFPALEELAGATEVPVEFAGEVFEVGEPFLGGGGGGDGLVGEVGAAVGGFVFQEGEIRAGEGELAGGIQEDAEVVGAVEDGADVFGKLADVRAVVAGAPKVAEAAEHGLDAEAGWGLPVGGEVEIPVGGFGVFFEEGFHAGHGPGGFAPGVEVAGGGCVGDELVEPASCGVVFNGHHGSEAGGVADGKMEGAVLRETAGDDADDLGEVGGFVGKEAVADVGFCVGDEFLGGAISGAVEAEGAGGSGARGGGGEEFGIGQDYFFDFGLEDRIEAIVADSGFREDFPCGIGVGAEGADDLVEGCGGGTPPRMGAVGGEHIRFEDGAEVLSGAGVEVEGPGGGGFGLEAAHEEGFAGVALGQGGVVRG